MVVHAPLGGPPTMFPRAAGGEATDEAASQSRAVTDTITPTASSTSDLASTTTDPALKPTTPQPATPQPAAPQPTTPQSTAHSSSADLATLQSVDLATIILTERAKATRGWCRELASTAAVCSTWREALQVVEKEACQWYTFTWRVKAFSQLCKSKPLDEGVVVQPEENSGVHDWQLWLVPRACRHEQPQEEDEAERLVEVIGVYLQVRGTVRGTVPWHRAVAQSE